MKKKYKSLLKNIGLLTISNFGSKILVLFLIPLYTSVLSTEQYGIFDFYSTTLSLIAPILTLNIVHAVMRFCMDDKYNNVDVISIGIKKELFAQFLFVVIVLFNYIFDLIPIFNRYPLLLIFLFFSQRTYIFLSQLSRGLDKISALAVGGVINSVVMLSLNILFLLVFKMGLDGYFLANIIAGIVPSIYMFFALKLHKMKFNKINKKINSEMVKYSKPMIFSTIGWWINNVSDRYIITWVCGIAANGIYSVAYKIPSMLNIVQNIFNQAWIISATKEYGDKSDEFYSTTYSMYNLLMICICTVLIIFNKFIAKILFNNDFYLAWKYAPFLMISALFTGVFGYLEGIFVAAKDTKIIASSTCIGALINIVLNFVLIYLIGPLGAAISTMISSIVIWIIRIVKVKKMISFNIRIYRDIVSYCILIIQGFTFLLSFNIYIVYLIEFICCILIFILYFRDMLKLFNSILLIFKKKQKN